MHSFSLVSHALAESRLLYWMCFARIFLCAFKILRPSLYCCHGDYVDDAGVYEVTIRCSVMER